MRPERVPMPDRLPVFYPQSVADRDIHGLAISLDDGKVSIETTTGPVEPEGFFDWLPGKTVYMTADSTGAVDLVFRVLPIEACIELANTGQTKWPGKEKELTIFRRANKGDMSLSVRRGNQWGSLINGEAFLTTSDDPRTVARNAKAVLGAFTAIGLTNSLAMPGATARALVMTHLFSSTNPRGKPHVKLDMDALHIERFLQSNRGPRMESVSLGLNNVADYDMASSYPSALAEVVSLADMQWVDSTKYVKNAFYAAAFCDLEINPSLERGPVSHRYGGSGDVTDLFSPVGSFTCWLNKPEIDMLLDYPELGRIVKVHEGSWGIPATGHKPYDDLMQTLYALRNSKSIIPRSYWKKLMVACYGILGQTWPVSIKSEEIQAAPTWNPIFMSHITASIRARNYRVALENGVDVVGEYADGITIRGGEIPTGERMGDYRLEGSGPMVIWDDLYKDGAGKESAHQLDELAPQFRDEYVIKISKQRRRTLGDLLINEKLESGAIGELYDYVFTFQPGSTSRMWVRGGRKRIGEYLTRSLATRPPKPDELSGLKLVRAIRFGNLVKLLEG